MSLLTEASLVVTPNAYKEGKLYSIIPSNGNGDFTVTRATTATRINAAGLVELVPYNLLQYSQAFDNTSYWSYYQATITANNTTAPDGTLTADRLNQSVGTGGNVVVSTANNNIGNITLSAYLKIGNGADGVVALNDGSWKNGFFNLTLGTVTYVDAGVTASITDAGNGWWRCSITINASTNSVLTNIGHNLNTGQFGYIWGAQLVEGTSALNYQATETRLNIPRIDYSLGGCPNILLEPQRTNIALYSEDFADSIWQKVRTTVTQNTTLSPNNTLGADTIEVTAPGQCHIGQSVTTTTTTLNVSIYCKYINQQFLQIYSSSANTAYANFDILNGVVGSNGTNASNVQITTAANGFYRLSVSLTVPVTAIVIRFAFIASSASAYNATEGVAGRQFYAWGAQFESGAYATSYIPTTTATVTRNADVISRGNIFTTGLITASGGTWFVELKNNLIVSRDVSLGGIFINTGTNSTAGDGFSLRNSLSTGRANINKVVGGLSATLFTINIDTVKVAIKWNGTTADVFVNGIKVVTGTAFTVTAMENLRGEGQNRAMQFNSIALFPTPLTDGQCSMLTSGIYTPALAYAQLSLVSESPACLTSSVNALL